MHRIILAFALALAACERGAPPPPLPELPQSVAAPWFICDAIDAPALFVFEREHDLVRVAEYDKPNGAIVARTEYNAGAPEGAAGSVYTPLTQDGAAAGAVRQVNPELMETPGAAYTTPFTSVRLGEREVSCRWLPRTRVMGFTGRRSFVVHEDVDGDLIYTSYDFAGAAEAQIVELSDSGRTTTFSTEVRGGVENVTPRSTQFRFNTIDRYTYVVTLEIDGSGMMEVLHNSAWTQGEPLIAHQLSAGPE